MLEILFLIPWALFIVAAPFVMRRHPRLASYPPRAGADAPLVSVIVPARNEAENVGICLASLLDSAYPNREILVVDDRSEDGTGEIARVVAERSRGEVRLVEGKELPPGWFGKPWACWQGYLQSRGELLLFTDADTHHHRELLGRAVAALERERVDLVTVMPHQVMASFWERLVMPHVFVLLTLRYPDAARVNRSRIPMDAVANGQFMLFRRGAYEAMGGHDAVRGEVVEDLRFAQRVVASGRRLFLAHGEEFMQTRMYRSLGGIVEGWSKNVATGARLAVARWLRPFIPWLLVALVLVLWVLPPLVLAASIAPQTGPGPRIWSSGAVALSLIHWALVYARLRAGLGYVLLYPLGALVAAGILARSAWRGSVIEWKGRIYGVEG